MKIGLIGDYDETVPAHQAIPKTLKLASEQLGIDVEYRWVPTEKIQNFSSVSEFDGLWCVPASPYRNTEGALLAIQYARVHHVPFLGTCGGFQHAIIEYARNVLGWKNAEHEETAPEASQLVISQLACSLVETTKAIRLTPNSKISEAYERKEIEEGYRCRYGLNPAFEEKLISGQLQVGARDDTGEVRAVELVGDHPFFIATLFQPERAALKGQLPPLTLAFVKAIQLQLKNIATTSAEGNQRQSYQYTL